MPQSAQPKSLPDLSDELSEIQARLKRCDSGDDINEMSCRLQLLNTIEIVEIIQIYELSLTTFHAMLKQDKAKQTAHGRISIITMMREKLHLQLKNLGFIRTRNGCLVIITNSIEENIRSTIETLNGLTHLYSHWPEK